LKASDWEARGAARASTKLRERTSMKITNYFSTLWAGPDPVLAEAGIAGELLVAKIRLALATLLLVIPVINSLFFFPVETKEGLIGLSLASGTFAAAATMYVLISRGFNPSWLGFVSSGFDVTLITAALGTFLLVNQPHTAVNSKVVFEGYFLAIGSTSLRYDKRICITAGLLAFAEYFAIVCFTARHWDLNSAAYAPYPYGLFSWSAQISRLIMMLTASVLSIALVARSQRLLHLATRDSLTGLFNRGYVDDRLAMELSRARRYGKSLTLAVIDADHFKALNDTHGHAAGDVVLKKLGELLRSSFRQSDTTGRYGGEEFVVILPETDLETARRKVEMLREQIAATAIGLPERKQTVRVTISAGLASFPEDGDEAAELFAIADERMFEAKHAGRNRVVAGSAVAVA
jgi:two-component system cell cycle response regulator